MQDTLADNWRQRMAGRSAVCAVLLAVPVAVAAQISFSAGLDNVPFGVSTFAEGPQTSSIGPSSTVAPGQNLTTLLDDAPAGARPGAGAGPGAVSGGGGLAGGPATEGVSGGTGGFAPTGGPGEGSGGNPGDGGSGGGTNPQPPEPVPPAPPAPSPEPPPTPAPQPVPGVNVPDVGAVVDSVTAPLDQATGLVPGGG